MSNGARVAARLVVLAALVLLLGGAAAPVAAVPRDEPVPPPVVAPPPPPPPPEPSPASPSPEVTIAATGDIALNGGARGDPFLRARRYLRGDVVLGNLEGTLATSGASKCAVATAGCYAFRAPPWYARYFARAGFTVLNLANNHAHDFGATGLAQTTAALRAARLSYTGRPGQISFRRIGGIRVAVVGFAPYPWAQSLLDLPAAARLVRRAARRVDIVVATMHAGAEGTDRTHVRPGEEYYLGEPRGNVVAFAHAVVRAGADLVVGHGPHVVRGMEWYHRRLIAYSLGNFAGQQTLSTAGILGAGAILRVTLHADGSFDEGDLVPVRLVGVGTPTFDTARTAQVLVRRLSREDFHAAAVRVLRGGRLR